MQIRGVKAFKKAFSVLEMQLVHVWCTRTGWMLETVFLILQGHAQLF